LGSVPNILKHYQGMRIIDAAEPLRSLAQ
jgi:hypothetical protein